MKQEFKNQLITGILSAPIIYIPHSHGRFVDEILKEIISPEKGKRSILELSKNSVIEFDMSRGIIDFETKRDEQNCDGYHKIQTLLKDLINKGEDKFDDERIFLLKNFSEALRDSGIQSLLQSFVSKYENGDFNPLQTIIIVSSLPVSSIPFELEKHISVIDILPPSLEEIEGIVSAIDVSVQWKYHEDDLRQEFCRNLQGLQLDEIRQIIRSCLIRTGGKLTKQTIQLALDDKKNIVRKSGIIEVVDTDVTFNDIGGLESLKEDLKVKAKIFKHLNLALNKKCRITLPKGVLIIGMPGCGKSMIAKSIANEFGVSLLRLDVSRLMGQYVGQSEENLRKALSTAEAAHPCVLWIDEIEKAFAGSNDAGGNNDMLVMRMMGYFLTWMQERKTAVYIVATANDIMRPEFMRKGRFDEVYFVDFPNAKEREDIFRNKIDKYKNTDTNHTIYDFTSVTSLDNIVKESVGSKSKNSGFSGSEIECVINTVIEQKFIEYVNKIDNDEIIDKVEITEKDIIDVIKGMKDSVMANQKDLDNNKGQTAITRINELKTKFRFKSASKASDKSNQ